MDVERVIYIGSFNKLLFPGLRIAYAILPGSLVQPFVKAKHAADGHTNLLLQGVLAAFIDEGHLAQHVRATRAIYDERRLIFLEEASVLGDLLEFGPAHAGLHVACTFRAEGVDDRSVASSCASQGVIVDPLSKFGHTGRGGLVFGFVSGTRPSVRSGLAIVRQAILSACA